MKWSMINHLTYLSLVGLFLVYFLFVCLLYKHKESREKKRDTEVYYHRKRKNQSGGLWLLSLFWVRKRSFSCPLALIFTPVRLLWNGAALFCRFVRFEWFFRWFESTTDGWFTKFPSNTLRLVNDNMVEVRCSRWSSCLSIEYFFGRTIFDTAKSNAK